MIIEVWHRYELIPLYLSYSVPAIFNPLHTWTPIIKQLLKCMVVFELVVTFDESRVSADFHWTSYEVQLAERYILVQLPVARRPSIKHTLLIGSTNN